MQIQATALENNQRAMHGKIIKAISTPQNVESKDVLDKQSVQKEVKRLLRKHNLTLDDIMLKYREIYDGKIAGTKVSDVVKVLENLTKLHNIGTQETTDELTITLGMKDTQQLAEYTQDTLQKTQEVIARLQARRINKQT